MFEKSLEVSHVAPLKCVCTWKNLNLHSREDETILCVFSTTVFKTLIPQILKIKCYLSDCSSNLESRILLRSSTNLTKKKASFLLNDLVSFPPTSQGQINIHLFLSSRQTADLGWLGKVSDLYFNICILHTIKLKG